VTIYTIYTPLNDSRIASTHAVWNTARGSGGTLTRQDTANLSMGVTLSGGDYHVYQSFLMFDTSTVPPGTPDGNPVLSLQVVAGRTDTVGVRVFNWGGTTADFRPATSPITNLPVFGSRAFSSADTGNRVDITGPADIPRTANYRLMMYGERQLSAGTPAANWISEVRSADTAGTVDDPYLRIKVPDYIAVEAAVVAVDAPPATLRYARRMLAVPAVIAAEAQEVALRPGKALITAVTTVVAAASPVRLHAGLTAAATAIASAGAATLRVTLTAAMTVIAAAGAVLFSIRRRPPISRTFTFPLSTRADTRTFRP
jgi:hypothetical protein